MFTKGEVHSKDFKPKITRRPSGFMMRRCELRKWTSDTTDFSGGNVGFLKKIAKALKKKKSGLSQPGSTESTENFEGLFEAEGQDEGYELVAQPPPVNTQKLLKDHIEKAVVKAI